MTITLMYLCQQVPHIVQQTMSSESTPILCSAIPSFEMFITLWEKLLRTHKNLKKYIDPGLQWAYMYYSCMDNTQAYIVTMRTFFFPTPNNYTKY